MSVLVVKSGKHKSKKITLPETEAVIGREEGCFIRLASTEVSRRHCMLVQTSRGLLIRDLGSQNGTIVNDVLIESETILQPGDLIKIGPIQFLVDGSRAASAPVPRIDDNIAEWLSDSDTSTELPATGADTTILKVADIPSATPRTDPRPQQKAPSKSSKAQFETLAEEARDIIRRHQESISEDK